MGKDKIQKAVLAVMVLVALVLAAGCGKSDTAKEVWGRVESREVDVNTKVPGRVLAIMVKEGDQVQKGQVVAKIDSRDILAKVEQLKAQVNAADAQKSQAGTSVALADRTTQAAVQSAAAQVEKTAADLRLARKNYERYKSLNEAGAVSSMVLDSAKTQYDAAQAAYTLAQAAMETANANLLQGQLNRDNEVAAQGKLAQAKAALDEALILLEECEIKAPVSGIVTSLIMEKGEIVSTGMPIMTILDPNDNWVNVKVRETDLARYKINSKVELRGLDAGLKLEGTIVDVSKKPEFATYRATNERGEYDITTYNVKIQVNSDQLRPGMRLQMGGGGSGK